MTRFGDRHDVWLRPGLAHWLVIALAGAIALASLAVFVPRHFPTLFPLWVALVLAAVNRLADQPWQRLRVDPDDRCWLFDDAGNRQAAGELRGNFASSRALLLHMNAPRCPDLWLFRHQQPDAFRRLARWLQLAKPNV